MNHKENINSFNRSNDNQKYINNKSSKRSISREKSRDNRSFINTNKNIVQDSDRDKS